MTCLEASKVHIFNGRCGLSLHLLYTNDSKARAPSAPWTNIAKGPSNLHSPVFSSSDPPGDGVADGVDESSEETNVGAAEAAEAAAVAMLNNKFVVVVIVRFEYEDIGSEEATASWIAIEVEGMKSGGCMGRGRARKGETG